MWVILRDEWGVNPQFSENAIQVSEKGNYPFFTEKGYDMYTFDRTFNSHLKYMSIM